jgi:lipoate-protein ligase A
VFAPRRLPVVLEDRFRLFAQPLVATYQSLGIDAVFRPVNDLHVAGRKIGGTGAARMSSAEVVVGSLMFDFDHATMARVLRVSSEKMRDKVAQALHDYVTTIRRELGHLPDREAVIGTYLEQVSQALGRPVVPGELTPDEEAALAEWEARMAAPEWTERRTSRQTVGLRISGDVTVHEHERKAPAGLVRATTTVRAGRFADVQISGDFTVLPGSAVADLEAALVGCDVTAVAPVVQDWLAGVAAPGLSAEDVVAVLDVRG